jgi:streptogramin lyase
MTMLLTLLLQVDTFAGTGQAGGSGDGGPATAAKIDNPFGVVRGPDGAIYFCEYDGQRVRRVGKDGVITTVAGSGEKGFANGPAARASFHKPHEIRFDARGDLFVADMMNHAIRKIDRKTGSVSTFAGTGQAGYAGDGGPAAAAQLKQPHSIQFGPDGALYVCDIGNHVIRRVDKDGRISTFAGTGKAGPTPDGAPIRGTPLNGPRSLDFDAQGRLWLATREGNQVFRLEQGRIHHVAGTGKKGFTGNGGPAREATLSGPKGIAVGPDGDVYLVDTESHTIRKIDAKSGRLELVIGTGVKGDGPDGPATACALARPHGIWVDPDGTLFVGDSENHRVRRFRPIR